MDIKQLYNLYLRHPEVSTDTRKISEGCIFFALKGDHFDGNSFAKRALDAGAAYSVIDKEAFFSGERTILVENVLQTLQELAAYHRSQLSIPIIGITGTNGKTTTKELIKSVLATRFNTFATLGNLNNHIGVPLTLLSIHSNIEMAIIEMGANHQKEIEFLCAIAKPDYGLITNVGKAHLEGFGGFEGVKKGKGELYAHLKTTNGIAFINRDNHFLMEMAASAQLEQVVYYGNSDDCLIKGKLIENDPFLTLEWTDGKIAHKIKSHLTGIYNAENILAAITIGTYFNLTPGEINDGVESYLPTNNRSQVIQTASNTLICDYYNANPSSMQVALANFASIQASKKILILADMFELGDEAEAEHLEVLSQANRIDADLHIFIGLEFYKLSATNKGTYFKTTEEAFEFLKKNPIQSAYILIKGSRGMKLEKLAELF